MAANQQLADELAGILRSQTRAIAPSAGLADRVIRQRRRGQARVRAATVVSLVVAAAAAVTLVLDGAWAPARLAQRPRLRLAGYAFRLPVGARVVSSANGACLLAFTVIENTARIGTAPTARQPAIANAVTRDGGCVSMLLTGAHRPYPANARRGWFPGVRRHRVQIRAYHAEIGISHTIGEEVDLKQGGTHKTELENIDLDLQLPAGGGRMRDLLIAAAGVSEQQLIAIVASGLRT